MTYGKHIYPVHPTQPMDDDLFLAPAENEIHQNPLSIERQLVEYLRETYSKPTGYGYQKTS